MRALYNKLGEKTYRYVAVGLCFLGDLELSKYLYDKFTTPELFNRNFDQAMQLLKMIYQKQGVNFEIPLDFKQQVYQTVVNGVLLILGVYLAFHLMNYTFFIFKKRFASMYLAFLTWTATFLAPIMGIFIFREWPIYGTLFIIQGFFFFFAAWGLRIYPVARANLK